MDRVALLANRIGQVVEPHHAEGIGHASEVVLQRPEIRGIRLAAGTEDLDDVAGAVEILLDRLADTAQHRGVRTVQAAPDLLHQLRTGHPPGETESGIELATEWPGIHGLPDAVEQAPGQSGIGCIDLTLFGMFLQLAIECREQLLGFAISGNCPGTQPFEQAASSPPEACDLGPGRRLPDQFANPQQHAQCVGILRVAQPGDQCLLVGRPGLGRKLCERRGGRLGGCGRLDVECDVEELFGT